MESKEKRRQRIARAKEWKKNNPEKVKESAARYRTKNKEKIEADRHQNRDSFNLYLKNRRLADLEGHRAKARAYRKENCERIKRVTNSRRVESPGPWHLKTAKKRARITGVAFDLDRQWFDERLKTGVCELSGLPFSFTVRSPNLPSIDRIDAKGPYTKGNCRLILWSLNRALSNLGDEYLMGVFRSIFIKRGEILEYEDRMAA